jgi:hypothetical protein
MDRQARSHLHQRRSLTARHSDSTGAMEFFNVLTSAELLQTTEALQQEHRERLYRPWLRCRCSCARDWKLTVRARRRTTAGLRSAAPMACARAVSVPVAIAERASAYRCR